MSQLKRLLWVITICSPVIVNSQIKTSSKGIQWIEGLTWQQLKEKAYMQNKYIFVDCYATWCKPCREMDEKVYKNDSVGQFMNNNFFSVKVQMDSTKKDNENIKLLYPTARDIEKKYKITALPTYLFFSPNGQIVHKSTGSIGVQQFISLSSEAMNPEKQLYKKLAKWQSHQMPFPLMPDLVKQLREQGEDSIALVVARGYMIGYLDKLSDKDLLTFENIVFLYENRGMVKTRDRIFSIYQQHEKQVDSVAKSLGYSKSAARSVIVREEILEPAQNARLAGITPDWTTIQKNLNAKYGKGYEVLEVMWTRLKYSEATNNDWDETINSIMVNWKKHKAAFSNQGLSALDVLACRVYNQSPKKKHLKAAADWLKIASYHNAGDRFDILWDRSIVLFKIGGNKNKSEALLLASQYLESLVLFTTDMRNSESNRKYTESIIPVYKGYIDNMKKGIPYPYKL